MLRTQGDGLAEQGASASWGWHGLTGGPADWTAWTAWGCRWQHRDHLSLGGQFPWTRKASRVAGQGLWAQPHCRDQRGQGNTAGGTRVWDQGAG